MSPLPLVFSIEADGVAIARLEGEIGCEEVEGMVDAFARLVARGIFEFVVDFSEVAHVDYRGLRAWVCFAQALKRQGGEMKVCGMSPYIYAIFCSAGVQEAFDYYEGIWPAHAAFSGLSMGPRGVLEAERKQSFRFEKVL
ncbi:MAG: STAS domain-containing protein [Proteobacteria bacterium]|nr:STAS domain-containing protein [Cystobacterineae bacterium]MCL2258742.1 STAS domain-containing protein [Cystobacterineae bacterium]MCL2314306.1 STAS domain-containing protein [Pseudomonadota bacterium]